MFVWVFFLGSQKRKAQKLNYQGRNPTPKRCRWSGHDVFQSHAWLDRRHFSPKKTGGLWHFGGEFVLFPLCNLLKSVPLLLYWKPSPFDEHSCSSGLVIRFKGVWWLLFDKYSYNDTLTNQNRGYLPKIIIFLLVNHINELYYLRISDGTLRKNRVEWLFWIFNPGNYLYRIPWDEAYRYIYRSPNSIAVRRW